MPATSIMVDAVKKSGGSDGYANEFANTTLNPHCGCRKNVVRNQM